jgi:hypothetical protein
MNTIFILLYSFFLFLFTLGAIFILYHLIRYSLDKTLGLVGAIFFSVIFCFLVVTNASFFLQLKPEQLLDETFTAPLAPSTKFAPHVKVPTRSNPW